MDSMYQDEILKKFQECEHAEIPINQIYNEMVNSNFYKVIENVDLRLNSNISEPETNKEEQITNLLKNLK